MFSTFLRRSVPALAIVALAACGDDPVSADQVTLLASEDVAASSGEAIALDLAVMLGAEADALGAPAGPGLSFMAVTPPAGCTQQEDGGFSCPNRAEGTVTWSRLFYFYDGTTVQDGYDALTTDSIVFITAVTGTASRGGYTADFARDRHITLSGLDGTETQRTWNGFGSGSRSETWTGERGTRTYDVISMDSVQNVVVNLPRTSNPYPASGSMIHRVEVEATFSGTAGDGSRTFSRRVQVTFNGTASVPLTINDRSCTLNLATRQVTCP